MININTEGTLNIKSTSDLIFKGVSTEVDRLRNETERDLIIGPRYLSDPAQIISTKDLFISTTKETTFTDITLESKGNMTLTI